MKFANAIKLNRKSGVRWCERGAPVRFPLGGLRPCLVRFPLGWLCPCPVRFPFIGLCLLRCAVKTRGIPYLAKNERDMGHPRVRERFQNLG
jgi:hypothetical protein